MQQQHAIAEYVTRRGFLHKVSDGLCGFAISYLAANEATAVEHTSSSRLPPYDLSPAPAHFASKATSVIHLCMQGGPSQVDLFDPKPALSRHAGSAPPRSLTENAVFENDRTGSLMPSPFQFARHGQSGAWVSELLPHLAREVDSIAIVRSMYNVHPNHEPAVYKLQTGQTFPGHPAMGTWIAYGLGNENQNLPAYIVLADPVQRLPVNGVENWMSAYLPPVYQGTQMRPTGAPLLNLRPDYKEPAVVSDTKRAILSRLDHAHRDARPRQGVLDARISNYEMAARMQVEAMRTLDLSSETQATLDMYGIGDEVTDSFGRRCLLARRLIERGVRFVQLFPRGQAWDNHSNIRSSLPSICQKTDKPVSGLLRDLRQRGLLDSTLVAWGGEFGRLPMAQGGYSAKAGRDHGPYGFSSWLAGGGVKGGVVFGSTDELGYAAVEHRVSIQDWHATILHTLGLDYQSLVFHRNGLPERLTHQFDARVVHEILT